MTDQLDTPRTRRALLAAALGAGAATVASAIARPLPANATDNQTVLVGGEYTAESQTAISTTVAAVTALRGDSTSGVGVYGGSTSSIGVWGASSSSTGVKGSSTSATGVSGSSTTGIGIVGTSTSDFGIYGSSTEYVGILGESTTYIGVKGSSVSGVGVEGSSQSSVGILGFSNSSFAVDGSSNASDQPAVVGRSYGNSTGVRGSSGNNNPTVSAKTGVHGFATEDATAIGVKGESTGGTGVSGVATTGVGVLATSAGTALQVAGKAKFSRSGKASILANAKYVDVTVPGGLTANSVVHATIQTYRSGVFIVAARPNWPTAGKARIYINKVASTTSSTPVGWFVAEY